MKRTYASLRVVCCPVRILIEKWPTALTLRTHPVMAAVLTHTAAQPACRFKARSIEVTRVRVTITVASWRMDRLWDMTTEQEEFTIAVLCWSEHGAYSCRCWQGFPLQASRGSRGESPDISHSSLLLCYADKHICRESEEEKEMSLRVTLTHPCPAPKRH